MDGGELEIGGGLAGLEEGKYAGVLRLDPVNEGRFERVVAKDFEGFGEAAFFQMNACGVGFVAGVVGGAMKGERGVFLKAVEPTAREPVAAFEFVVEETEGQVAVHRLDPEGEACQLDSEGIEVHAVEAALDDEAFEAGADGVARMGHEVCAQVALTLLGGVLSGPSFAQEVAMGQPAALVAASAHASVRETLVQAFHRGNLRVYANADVVGVEVGGAVKNVLAIATDLCDGLKLGLNARAAVITRGLAEMTRLGVALGAQAETFMGLSGLGDLVLTATGDLSRNRQVGIALAQGLTVAQAVEALGHVAEGVNSARTVVQRAKQLGVEMPIAQSVVGLLDGALSPQQAVALLMGRDAKQEL